ncbi:MAG: tRNA (N6-threonylcarbamoyladenosine(37)-N6)-methyltransferase TrmO [Syntrophaceae bacterium]
MTTLRPEPVICHAIGMIYSDHQRPEETPIQPVFARDCPGRVELFPEFAEGLKDIEGFSHLILLYIFDRAAAAPLTITPFMDDVPRGMFATRHPGRPNRIGLSVVRLIGREGTVLSLMDVDILDATPLIDIKPFVPRFDIPDHPCGGWTEAVDPKLAQARGRRGHGRRS